MKKIALFLSVAFIATATSSCVERSDKYQNLLSQRDSLLTVAQNYTRTLDVLNEVEAGLDSIDMLEQGLRPQVGGVESSGAQKQQLAARIGQIKELVEANSAKIALLQTQLKRSGRKNDALTQIVDQLQTELSQKATSIEELQAELSKKRVRIEELSRTVDELDADVARLGDKTADQQRTIEAQDADLNCVWHIVGTAKELKTSQVLSGNGLFRARSVMDKDFDKTIFVRSDLRQLSEIPTGSRKPKLLSSHPEASYELMPGDDRVVTIRIVDPAEFWSVSKFLVVQQ